MEDYKKKYEQAMLRMNKWVEGSEITEPKEVAEFVFPELKESDDERIRKNLREFLLDALSQDIVSHHIDLEETLNWLEKQGESLCWIKCSDELPNRDGTYLVVTDGSHNDVYDMAKYNPIEGWHKASEIIYWMPIPQLNNKNIIEQNTIDKVEPKFKAGDWVVFDNKISCHVDNIYQGKESLMYTITDVNNMTRSYSVKGFDNNTHFWTIKDAKKGDILQANKCTLIFDSLTKDIDGNTVISSWYYCDTHTFYGTGPSQPDLWVTEGIVPATKEQCDLLFSKMKEAGYEWDNEKKELKRIDQNPPAYFYCRYGGTIPKCSDCKRNHFNSKYKRTEINTWMTPTSHGIKQCSNYIQQKPTWSKEDEEIVHSICMYLMCSNSPEGYTTWIDWLKSLKERYTWKPSEEQMKQLGWIAEQNKDNMIGKELMSLYQDLKKLKG